MCITRRIIDRNIDVVCITRIIIDVLCVLLEELLLMNYCIVCITRRIIDVVCITRIIIDVLCVLLVEILMLCDSKNY